MADLSQIKICSFNASGLRVKQKLRTILNYMKKNKMDIVLLQETHIVEEDISYIKKVWKGNIHLSGESTNSKGLLTLFNKSLPFENIEILHKTDRLLTSRVSSNDNSGRHFLIVNVYGPNEPDEKPHFLKELSGHLRKIKMNYPHYYLICAGDVNVVHDNDLDIISGRNHNIDHVNMFKELVKENMLIDSWRHMNGMEKMYTWKRGEISRRLDYILIDNDIEKFLQDTSIEGIGFSDHLLCTALIKFDKFKYGRSYYKMNVSILSDNNYVNIMREKIPEIIHRYEDLDPHLQWEMTKVEIREFTQKYCKTLHFEKERQKVELKKLLNDIERNLADDPTNNNLIDKQAFLKGKWEDFLLEETRGRQIRSGIKWMEEGEKSSKFFLGLEKARAINNTIFELNIGGRKITKETEILNEISKYYKILYTEDAHNRHFDIDIFNTYIDPLVIPTISEDSFETCEEEISMKEMAEAVLKMKNGSTPGCDGIPVEFYKIFFNEIKHVLFKSFIHSFVNKKLPVTQQKGIVSLLHKGKNLDRDNLDNWRPLSLTNADYKILAKIIAIRIQGTLHEIVHRDQCGFIKGRDIANLLREIDDIIENNKDENNEFILLAIDYRKAFDTIKNDFILKCLELFGFGEYIIQWINIILHNRTFCVKNGGHISGSYLMQRGVRQGCPLSPLIFIIAIELLGISTRQSDSIKGIQVRIRHFPVTHKIKQYADDTTFLLRDFIDFREVLSKIKEFSKVSGLCINKKKTNAMFISKKDPRDINSFEGIKFVNKIKLLGIFFSNNESARDIEENWTTKIEKLSQNLTLWTRRNLTLFGKVTIIKTFGLSQFIYVMKSIGIPLPILQRINRILFSFIWGKDFKSGRTFEKIKRKVLCRNIEEGGLNMIDIIDMQNTFYIKWALRLLTDRNQLWTAMPIYILRGVGGENAFLCEIQVEKLIGLNNIKSKFWKEVLHTWLMKNKNGKLLDLRELRIIDRPIFNNNSIRYTGKTLFLKDTIDKGIFCVRDFVKDNQIITFDEFIYKVGGFPRANLDYNVIYNALFQLEINESGLDLSTLMGNALGILNMDNKLIRNLISDGDNSMAIGQQYWNKKFENDIMDRYTAVVTCTKEIKLKELIFKIFHNIYPTNFMLQKMKLSPTTKCDHCESIDYIDHFFVTCERLNAFWNAVIGWIEKETGLVVENGMQEKLFGIIKGEKSNYKGRKVEISNLILLIAKLSIVKARTFNTQNIVNIFEEEILKREKYLKL